jgi:hypothetical protein
MAHNADDPMDTTCEVSDDRTISKGLWPPRSPSLSNCDFSCQGNLKEKMYTNNPTTAEDLQNETCVN